MIAVFLGIYIRVNGRRFLTGKDEKRANLKVVRTTSTKPDNQSRAAMLSPPAYQSGAQAGPLPRRE